MAKKPARIYSDTKEVVVYFNQALTNKSAEEFGEKFECKLVGNHERMDYAFRYIIPRKKYTSTVGKISNQKNLVNNVEHRDIRVEKRLESLNDIIENLTNLKDDLENLTERSYRSKIKSAIGDLEHVRDIYFDRDKYNGLNYGKIGPAKKKK